MSSFSVLFPAGMIVLPAFGLAFWCWLTNLRLPMKPMVATLVALLLFGLSWWLVGPRRAMQPWHTQLWGMGGFFAVFFGFVFPWIRRAFAELPQAEGVASLRARALDAELFRGAWAGPWAAWLALVVAVAWRGTDLLGWLSPVIGGAALAALRPILRVGVREPEPLGGPDPEALAERYARFRRRRLRFMYALFVGLALFLTASPLFGAVTPHLWGWNAPVLLGPAIGLAGGLFGIWCDAQRYLLRRQLAGREPPDGTVQSATWARSRS